MWEQVGSGLPSPFPSLAPAPAAAQNTASICQSYSEPGNECTEGDTVAGSCQSRMSRGISKPRRVPREDSRGDTPRGDTECHGNKGSERAAPAGGHRGSVERGGGRAGLPRPSSTLHYGIKQPSCSALAPQSR